MLTAFKSQAESITSRRIHVACMDRVRRGDRGKRGANLCRTALAAVLGPRRSSAAPGRAEDFHLACPATQYPSHSPETYAGDLRPAYLPGWAPVRSGVEAVLLLAEDHVPHTMPEA